MTEHPNLKKNTSLADQKGQVAIFIALIFQLLFLFFAMIVNVGLLVHHKINLQNSVDLAAYYGAMKQSEVMNTIGHVNYQIRQSYKLLTWRYRVLGTAGVFPKGTGIDPEGGSPVTKDGEVDKGVRGARITENDNDGIGNGPNLQDYYDRPAFCLAFRPFKEVPDGENTCRSPRGQTIAALRSPPVIAGFIGAAHTARRVTELANLSKAERCDFAGPYNYVALARFIVGFNIDQGDRKLLIYKLANNLSQSTDDFVDLEGERATEGIRKTLDNNLTTANKDAVKSFKVFNSLASGRCGQIDKGGSSPKPPGWLAEVSIYPRASYKMCYNDADLNSKLGAKGIDFRPKDPDKTDPKNVGPEGQLKETIDYLSQYISLQTPGSPFRPSLGVEKNPWCMAYVGVSATTEPSIPFALGKIKLKAVAFAKPFGGRIGPWYGKSWSPGVMESSGAGPMQRTDPRTPPRCAFGDITNCAPQGQDAATTMNYSRFPGDPVGLASRRVHGQYGKSLFDLGTPTFDAWAGIETGSSARGKEWDILAFGGGPETKLRNLEISAVVPDVFDLTYYSIDPDFYNNYYLNRLEKYMQKHPISGQGGYTVRLDIGSRSSGAGLPGGRPAAAFNIKDQLMTAMNLKGGGPSGYSLDWDSKLMYALVGEENFGSVLTGWVSKRDLADYSMDDERFGKCSVPAKNGVPVPGGCEKGGRTGYSVKLISSDYLLDSHSIGGEGSSSAKILNPPEDDFLQ